MASSYLYSPPRTLRLPLRDYPSVNRFALDLVTGEGRALEFLPRAALDRLSPSGTPRERDALAAALERTNAAWGNDVRDELARWNAGKSVTIISGQQVTFGGGPLYTLAKIASMLKLRASLADRGVPSTIFFWMATEDSDYAEVTRLYLQRPGGEMERVESAPHSDSRRVVGNLDVPAALRERVRGWIGQETEWLREGITFGESFARLLAEALRGRGVVLVDSLLPEVRAAGGRLFQSLLRNLPRAEAEIATRSEALRAAGYEPQVATAPDGHYSLLFYIDDREQRAAIRRDEKGWRIDRRRFEESVVLAIPPEQLSTAALARPLLQDYVFAPDVFIGGPAEVAYYAQLAPLHEMLAIRRPAVMLRGHALAAPGRTIATIERYGIRPSEIFRGADAIIAARDPQKADEVERAVAAASSAVEESLEPIRRLATEADRTLQRAMERSLRRIQFHFSRISERARRAALRSDRQRYDAVSRLCETLAPEGIPQDRITSWLGYWLVYGPSLVERLAGEIEPDSDQVKIIGL